MRNLENLNSVKIYNKDYNIFNYENFISGEKLFKIASDNPIGFTIDCKGNPINKGFSVGLFITQNSFGYIGAVHVANIANEGNYFLGGWLNTANNQYYFDAVVIFDFLVDALEFAKIQGQKAIFDLTNKKEILL